MNTACYVLAAIGWSVHIVGWGVRARLRYYQAKGRRIERES